MSAVAGVRSLGTLSIEQERRGIHAGRQFGGLTGATSNSFTVDPGAAAALAITTMPVAGQSGVLLSPQPVIRLVDANGDPDDPAP